MKPKEGQKTTVQSCDIDVCKYKILAILAEYNCSLLSQDDWSNILIRDNDTQETKSMSKNM